MNASKKEYMIKLRQAITYCLAYELQDKGLSPRNLSQQAAEAYEPPAVPPDDLASKVLYYANLAAQEIPAEIKTKTELTRHPLYTAWQEMGFKDQAVIGLVYGGATKIKGYVFESARLPEVRGASALLDRVNMVDIRALWGEGFDGSVNGEKERAKQVQKQYKCLQCPKCVIYAGGGNFLAFVPLSVASLMADQVERLYTTETLVANSAVVAKAFSLLELLYGRRPDDYWLEDWRGQRGDGDLSLLLEGYYGGLSDDHFSTKKRFPELVTVLASEMMRRRGEWGDEDGRQKRYIPHYELLPYAIKCHSCDVRPAAIRDEAAAKEYCEPCARKRVSGQVAKKESEDVRRWFTRVFSDWFPQGVGCWESRFDDFLSKRQHSAHYYQDVPKGAPVLPANDLNEIGQGSVPQRYIGLIYADGNDMSDKIARLSSATAYSRLSEGLFEAAQAAVFEALAEHLSPVWIEEAVDPERPNRRRIWVHPWEIITIGGDDLIVIVPGSKALDVALSIGEKFEKFFPGEKKARRYEGQRYHPHHLEEQENGQTLLPAPDEPTHAPDISLSAGVVVAHATTPIFFLWELAEQLIKSAKRWRKEMNRERQKRGQEPYQRGTVDFMALKSMGMVASRLKEFRERAYELEGRRLTARPYTWVELRGLLEAAQAIYKSGLGRSQVYRLQDFLMQGQESAAINYLYAFARLRPEERRELACAFHLAWHGPSDVPPWRRRPDGQVETIWRDLVEIYDFVKEEA